MKRICIVGGGFGGLEALKHLQEGLRKRRKVHVTLIDQSPHFLYTPVLPDVASGGVSSRAAELRLSDMAQGDRFKVRCGRVTGFDFARHEVLMGEARVGFDYLILALGSEADWGDLDDPAGLALPWKRSEDAQRVLRRVMVAFAELPADLSEVEARRRLTFVVAGAGATGVEFASELSAGVQQDLLPRVPDLARKAFRVVLVEPEGEVLPAYSRGLRERARAALLRQGVELILGDKVVSVREGEVGLGNGATIRADHLIWAGGVRPPSWLSGTGLPLNAHGEILVEEDLSVCGLDQVFAVGDSAQRVGGDPWPRTAQRAAQQGPTAANNILMDMVGASLDPFEYTHWGNLIRLGHKDAVFELGRWTLTGSTAWTLVRLAQIALAPTGTKKVALLAEWSNNLMRGREWTRLPL